MLNLPPPWTLQPGAVASPPTYARRRRKCAYCYRRGNPKHPEVKLSQCHFVHHKFHMDSPGIEPMTLVVRHVAKNDPSSA
jgi:hypothetical protein